MNSLYPATEPVLLRDDYTGQVVLDGLGNPVVVGVRQPILKFPYAHRNLTLSTPPRL